MGNATYYIVYYDTLCCSIFLQMLDVWIPERLHTWVILSCCFCFFFQWFFPEKVGWNLGWNGYRVGTPSYKDLSWTQKNTGQYDPMLGATICWYVAIFLVGCIKAMCQIFEENDELCVRNSNDHGPWHPKLGSWLWWPTSFGLVSNFSETWLHLNMRHTFKIVISWEAMRHCDMETHGPSQVSWLLSFYQMWVPMKDSSLENTKRFVSKLGTLSMDHRGSYMVNDFNVPILGYSPFSDKPMLLKLFPMSSGHPWTSWTGPATSQCNGWYSVLVKCPIVFGQFPKESKCHQNSNDIPLDSHCLLGTT